MEPEMPFSAFQCAYQTGLMVTCIAIGTTHPFTPHRVVAIIINIFILIFPMLQRFLTFIEFYHLIECPHSTLNITQVRHQTKFILVLIPFSLTELAEKPALLLYFPEFNPDLLMSAWSFRVCLGIVSNRRCHNIKRRIFAIGYGNDIVWRYILTLTGRRKIHANSKRAIQAANPQLPGYP